MKHGNSNRRQRGRGGSNSNNRRGGQGNNRSRVFDSNGPEVRIRGTAYQVVEKYEALAKDAASSGDRVLAESYLQHAEHYVRIIASWEDSAPPQRQEKSGGVDGSGVEAQATKDAESEDALDLPASILGAPAEVSGDANTEAVSA